MPPLDEDALLLLLFAFTVAVVSLLLLLQAYMVCVLKRAAPHSRLPPRSTAAATAGGAGPALGEDAPTWVASLPGGSCGWVGDEEAGDCVVCLSALGEEEEGGGVRVLPRCKHAFHAGCIGRWLVSHSVCCPICRTPARPEPPAPSAAAAVTCPPRPPPPPLLAAPTGPGDEQATGGVGGAMGGYLAQQGVVLLGEHHQVTEELHLPLLLLY